MSYATQTPKTLWEATGRATMHVTMRALIKGGIYKLVRNRGGHAHCDVAGSWGALREPTLL